MGQLVALSQTSRAQRMPLGKQSARRVGHHLAAIRVVTVDDKLLSSPDRAQTQGFIGQQLVVSEAIVQFDGAHILRTETGLFVDQLGAALRHVETNISNH
ncbi:hypothetical protein D3C79_811190 [compost metagenome]